MIHILLSEFGGFIVHNFAFFITDIAREAGNDEHLHITSGTISLEYKPMQPNATDLDQQILEVCI